MIKFATPLLFAITLHSPLFASEIHFFKISPQSKESPNWHPIPGEKFPIINSEYLDKLREKHDFIKGISAYKIQLLDIGTSIDNRIKVFNYCFNPGSEVLEKLKANSLPVKGDLTLISKKMLNEIDSEVKLESLHLKKYVEIINPSISNHEDVRNAPQEHVIEDLSVNGIVMEGIRLNKSGVFMVTNNCTIPANESHAEKNKGDEDYSFPPGLLITSLSSDAEKIDALLKDLVEFNAGSRPGLSFKIEKLDY
jgi:hypothetical protein